MIAREWKAHYAAERARLGANGLRALFDGAPDVELASGGALVFPHTHLASSGPMVAAVARAVARSGAREVVALGVLHGGRERDHDAVAAARAGDPAALRALRRVHGPGAPDDAEHWSEEFSLDGFAALLPIACALEGTPLPRLVARYPFVVGSDPELPGLDELRDRLRGGAALVATTDPIHHGPGYGTPLPHRDGSEPATLVWARDRIERALDLLAAGDRPGFLASCQEDRSDFRDPGAALSLVLGSGWHRRVVALALADYAPVLGAPPPTWVAGALVEIAPTAAGSRSW